jgi:hypothetical protein
MVEEANAAAASMNDQATRLSELTAFFKLREGQAAAVTESERAAGRDGKGAPPGAASAAAAGAAAAAAAMRPSAIFANAAATGQVRVLGDSAVAQALDRAERRSPTRPWSQGGSPMVALGAARGAASGATNDWSEF